jgi:tetratricopeptide (TPR) repeat protein
VLFLEAGDPGPGWPFRDRVECVRYTRDQFEDLLEHYLEHEAERRALAAAARALVREGSFADLWEDVEARLAQERPRLSERAQARPQFDTAEELLTRTWRALADPREGDQALLRDLQAACAERPQAADLFNALGVALVLSGAEAADAFHRAWQSRPDDPVCGLNLAEALARAGRRDEALARAGQARQALERPAEARPGWLEGLPFPGLPDVFRVEWERAAWENAGRPAAEAEAKRTLLRWRLHGLLAELGRDPAHLAAAVRARPDLPPTRAALGAALARAGRPADALPHLRHAVGGNPFAAAAARDLFDVLGVLGDAEEQCRLARDRRLLARAAPREVPAEPWFVQAPPARDELVSVVVHCAAPVPARPPCLEGVLRHSRPPYELILLDPGTPAAVAETPAWLAHLQGPLRVRVLPARLRPFVPAGRAELLAHARGRFLVFLQAQAAVSAGWLEDLIHAARHDWPHVGLVGPMTNDGAGQQHLLGSPADAAGLPDFAAHRRRRHAARVRAVEDLADICLLVRREVYAALPDSRAGAGTEGDGPRLPEQVRRAGFRVLVARSVFVHDGAAAPSEGFLPREFPSAAPAGPPGRGAPRVSLSMIVRDEEANLPACLASVADLVWEVVIVDTGSADRTREVAARFGARVFDFPWVDSFAAARNESLRHAGGDWVFWLDADERVDEGNRRGLRDLLAALPDEPAAYLMTVLSAEDAESDGDLAVDQARLFRRHPDARWEYRVHEQILPAAERLGWPVRRTTILVHHLGYRDGEARRRKLERNFRLQRLEAGERPDDGFTLFNLGATYMDLGRPGEAIPVLRRALERTPPTHSTPSC